MSGFKLNNGLVETIVQSVKKVFDSKLRYWVEDRRSTSWVIEEVLIGTWMENAHRLDLEDVTPYKVKGRIVEGNDKVTDLTKVRNLVYKTLWYEETALAETLQKEGRPSDDSRKLLFRDPPELSGRFAPHVARRHDLDVSGDQRRALQILTNVPWVLDVQTYEDIKAYRNTLGTGEEANSIYYSFATDALDEEIQVPSEEALDDLFNRVGDTTVYMVVNRIDEPGRMYARAIHPMYSRFLRAIMNGPEKKLSERGWIRFTDWLCESYGFSDATELDEWAKRVDQNPLDLLKSKGKKGADELAAARAWLRARATGSTGYRCGLDFAAQGLGLIAALTG